MKNQRNVVLSCCYFIYESCYGINLPCNLVNV